MSLSFRQKTMLSIALVQLVLLGLFISLGLSHLRGAIELELYQRAETSGDLLVSAALTPLANMDLASLQNLTDQVQAKPGVKYVQILDRRGKPLATSGMAPSVLKPDETVRAVTGDIFSSTKKVTLGTEVYGQVWVGWDVAELRQRLRQLALWTISIALLEMLVVGVMSFTLGNYLLRGLKGLEFAAHEIAVGKVGHQVPIKGSDELSRTARAFNFMSRRLQESFGKQHEAEEELRRANEGLEERVAQRTEQLSHQALHDNLTKLPNRVLLADRLQQAITLARRGKHRAAMLIVDLDRFKEINDTLGHQYGDFVLSETATRLTHALRESDTVARLGGDEFAIVLSSVQDEGAVSFVVHKLLDIIETPIDIAGELVDVSASIGGAIFPDHAKDSSTLMKYADLAMYDAKRRKGRYSMYRPEMDQHSTQRLKFVAELRRAITADQFVLYYQPKVELATSNIMGVEALLRWNHPEQGLLFPDKFIALAEESGLIKPLTAWVVRATAKQLQMWRDGGLNVSVSVNIAAENLHDDEFPDRVSSILTEYQIDHSRLEMDISEAAIMVDQIHSLSAIKRLSEMGIKIAIDNFGTGYSSLAYIQKLAITQLKIDRTFVARMDQADVAQLVKSIIAVGHNLGLLVIAEGVENMTTWDTLKALGCDSAQGYCLAHPLPQDELSAWMAGHKTVKGERQHEAI